MAGVVPRWDIVAPDEVPRDVSVIVLLFFVFSFDDDVVARQFHRDFVRGELLNVQIYLELVLVGANRRSDVLGCSDASIAPWAIVHRASVEILHSRLRHRCRRYGRQQIVRGDSAPEVLVQNSGLAQRILGFPVC